MALNKASSANGLVRNSTAPAFIAWTVEGMSPWPVMKMIGISVRSLAIRFCKSRPLRPGRDKSRIRLLGTSARGRGTASNGREGIEAFRALRPDVTLMDLRLQDLSGLDVMIAIRSEFSDARVIVLTTFEGDMDVQRALKAGARGYLLKSMPSQQMLDMIRQVHAGKKCVPAEIAAGLAEHVGDEALSQREVQVLQQVAAGQRNRDIAAKLFIAEETVKVHLKHIMGKLGANDR